MASTWFFVAFLAVLLTGLYGLSISGGNWVERINRWYERRYGIK